MKYSILLSALPSAFGVGNIYPGACPELPNQPDFDNTRFIGQWYNYLDNDWQNVPETAECAGAYYELIDPLLISVNNTGVFNFEVAGRPTSTPSWAYGTAEVLDPEYPTQLYVSFNQFGGCGRYGFVCGGTPPIDNIDNTMEEPHPFDNPIDDILGKRENYRVTDTDYENYALIISCYNLDEEGDQHSEIIYLLVRDREWPKYNQVKVQELLYNAAEWGIDVTTIWEIDQSNCDKWAGLIP